MFRFFLLWAAAAVFFYWLLTLLETAVRAST